MKNTLLIFFFPVHKLRIKIYENSHLDRLEIKEQKREQTIKKPGINIIRINPDKQNFDRDDEIGRIQDFINESSLKLDEQSAKNKMI